MEAPDKIYIHKSGDVLSNPIGECVAYIRKDAILDKLKTQQDKCIFRSTYWDFWQSVINEIKAI